MLNRARTCKQYGNAGCQSVAVHCLLRRSHKHTLRSASGEGAGSSSRGSQQRGATVAHEHAGGWLVHATTARDDKRSGSKLREQAGAHEAWVRTR